jgi:prepilin-type N-terminal cleavage/methylation domain-containing protein
VDGEVRKRISAQHHRELGECPAERDGAAVSRLSRVRRLPSDRGFTLVEMLAVISILGVVLAVAFGALISSQKTVRGNANRLDQVQQGKTAMESMSKSIRTAVLPSAVGGANTDVAAFLQADWNKVSFYGNLNNQANAFGPSKVSYVLNSNGTLVETIQPSTGKNAAGAYVYCTVGAPGCQVKTRTVARNVVYDPSKPLFVYYSQAQPNGMTVPIDANALRAVNSIDIQVSVKAGREVPASTVVTRVSLPNVNAQLNSNPDDNQ